MNIANRLLFAGFIALLLDPAPGAAQTPSQPAESKPDEAVRPATTTFFGDTGLWFVPTAEVLAHGKWSVSGYRRGTNYVQGYSNVADFAGTFAVGIKDRAEVFGSFLVDTRIDRDVRPIFVNDPSYGGVAEHNPLVNQPWTGHSLGDLYLGAKINFLSELRQNPLALGVRGIVKVPTGDKDIGASTGKTDFSVDLVASKELKKTVEWAGYGGYGYRGKPDGFEAPTGDFRWGTGVSFPSRSPLRALAEVNGGFRSSDTVTITTAQLVGTDGSLPPVVSNTENLTRVTFGVTLQTEKGLFGGVGASWNLPKQGRLDARSEEGDAPFNDYWDLQVRIGYHPGVRVYVPPPPTPPTPAPAAAAAPPPAPEHTLTLRADCNPCSVEVMQSSMVTATAQDSIMCMLTYRWTAPSGTFANATARQTNWTAGNQEGTVTLTATATCPTDNKTASATVAITVTRPPVKTYTFEDVHFDFDRYTLRADATRSLDDAVAAMRADATLKLQIEGHTCNIGTAEYNLALGNRRANSVKDYLVSRGIMADRLTTISYGEEAPKYDNDREETRRLNRRAALVVTLQR